MPDKDGNLQDTDDLITQGLDEYEEPIEKGKGDEETIKIEGLDDKEEPSDKETHDGEEEISSEDKQPYTPEELDELLKSDGEIDTDRLSPEGKALMKSFQRGFGKKFEDLAKMKKEFEARKEEPSPGEPKTIAEAFMRDPQGVLQAIDGKIQALEEADQNDPQIRKLERMRSDLIFYRQMEMEKRMFGETQARDNISKARDAILEAVPDFQSKRDKLTKFVIEDMGENSISKDELNFLTNPNIVGSELAVKVTRFINAVYDKFNPVGIKKKEIKPKPHKVAQEGGKKVKAVKSVWELSDEEFDKDMEKRISGI